MKELGRIPQEGRQSRKVDVYDHRKLSNVGKHKLFQKRIPSQSFCKPDLTVKIALHEKNVVFKGHQDKKRFCPLCVPTLPCSASLGDVSFKNLGNPVCRQAVIPASAPQAGEQVLQTVFQVGTMRYSQP